MLSNHRDAIERVFQRVAAVFERLGFQPNVVTWLALVVALAGSALIAIGSLLLGAFVAGVGNALDLVDGALARRMNQATPFGGYLDSLLDRYADAAAFLAVGWHYQEAWVWFVVFLAFLGAVATSYSRARVYEDADPPGDAWADLVERGERLIVLFVAVGAQGAMDLFGFEVQFLPWMVLGLALLGHWTVLQRARRSREILQGGTG